MQKRAMLSGSWLLFHLNEQLCLESVCKDAGETERTLQPTPLDMPNPRFSQTSYINPPGQCYHEVPPKPTRRLSPICKGKGFLILFKFELGLSMCLTH